MENNIIKCEICGKEMLKKKINKEIEYNGNKIEFKEIEAYICDECNNVILESKEVKMIENLYLFYFLTNLLLTFFHLL